MYITRKALPRRSFLRGVGAAIALPMLDAMTPALSAMSAAPPRLGFVYIANGVIQKKWNPATTGPGFELSPTDGTLLNSQNSPYTANAQPTAVAAIPHGVSQTGSSSSSQ